MDEKPTEDSRHPQGHTCGHTQAPPNAEWETEANNSEPSDFSVRDTKERHSSRDSDNFC